MEKEVWSTQLTEQWTSNYEISQMYLKLHFSLKGVHCMGVNVNPLEYLEYANSLQKTRNSSFSHPTVMETWRSYININDKEKLAVIGIKNLLKPAYCYISVAVHRYNIRKIWFKGLCIGY